MAHRTRKRGGASSLAQRSPSPGEMSLPDIIHSNTVARPSNSFTDLVEKAMHEMLAVTYWFDPPPDGKPYPVTIRFSGHRVAVKGRTSAGDRFTQDEMIKEVVPGSGPISLTARVHNINSGSWTVTAHQLLPSHSTQVRQEQGKVTLTSDPRGPIARFWRKWAPSVASTETVSTCLAPLAHVPGTLPGIWGLMVALGIIVALTIQTLLIANTHLVIGPWWVVALVAIIVGTLGAKVWYLVLYRREHLINGWCIQGFITGMTLTTIVLLLVFHIPAGVFLDVMAPGLLFAMAIGRVGCFFAGCCGGPPTASHWGIWSSDQNVGARRIPTQLLELTLAASLGILTLVAILKHGSANGAFFVGAFATYTLVRQGILHLRAEPSKSRVGGMVTVMLAALVLITAIGCLSQFVMFASIIVC